MPASAQWYARSVILTGALVLAAAIVSGPAAITGATILCLALALIAATLKIGLPGVAGTLSPINMPILYASGELSLAETLGIAALAGFVQCIWRSKTRPDATQMAFNAATMSLAAGLSREIGLSATPRRTFLYYIVAAIVLQVVNALSVATILALLCRMPVYRVWRHCHLWSFPYEISAGAFAGLWAQSPFGPGFTSATMAAILLYLMTLFYGEVVRRIGSPIES